MQKAACVGNLTLAETPDLKTIGGVSPCITGRVVKRMEIHHDSTHRRLRLLSGTARSGAPEVGPTDFAGVVTRLLDEFDAADFRSAERILDIMRRQGRTVSGFPRIRPADCERVILAMRSVFEINRPALIKGDSAIVERFEQILEAFAQTDVRYYPDELMRVRILKAEVRLVMNDPAGVRALIGEYADRVYKIQGDFKDAARVMKLDCQARAAGGAIDGLGLLALNRAILLARLWPHAVWYFAAELIEFIAFIGSAPACDGMLAWLLVGCGRKTVRVRTAGSSQPRRSGRLSLSDFACGSPPRRVSRFLMSYFWLSVAAVCLFLLRRGDLHFSKAARKGGRASHPNIIVTRAMGGFGDLLMMTPGLRALSQARSARVKLVIERRFFDLFRNNPHIDLIDIDELPVDVAECRTWYNLTLCPAGRYEASRRPFARKGRVELFARGMGVNKRTLDRYGWGIECVLDSAQRAFRDDFVRRAGFGARPIVGVQPYSRDSYKDHLDIGRFVEALRARYDVIIFHHVETNLTLGPGIASTAGLSLGQSVALVSALQAMVCMDFRVPARGVGLRCSGCGHVRPDRRQLVYPSSPPRDSDLQ